MTNLEEKAHLLVRALVRCNSETKIQELADVLGYDENESLAYAIKSLAGILTVYENNSNIKGTHHRPSLMCAECGCKSLSVKNPIEPQEIYIECDNCGSITKIAETKCIGGTLKIITD